MLRSTTARRWGAAACVLAAGAFTLAGCGSGGSSAASGDAAAAPIPSSGTALLNEANAEGTVTIYTDYSAPSIDPLVAAFEKAYPKVKASVISISAGDLAPRVLTEQRGGAYKADVITLTAQYESQLMQDGALQKYVIPTEQPLPSQVNLPVGYQGVLGFDTEVIAYNPKELKAHGIPVPTSFADFANPEWKGHFSIIPTAPDIYQGMIQEYGQAKAQTLMTEIGNNKPRFETSHTQAALDVQSGVTWAAMSANGQGVLPLTKATPDTIQMVNPDPLFVKFELMDLAKNAPHPAAARLFLNWLSSQAGQQTMESTSGHSSVRTDVTENPAVWDPSTDTPLYLKAYETAAEFNAQYSQYQQYLHTSS